CLLYQALQNIYLYGIKESQCLKNKINSLQKKF
ncbi:ATPase, partial [Campylobacter jejuni]|nr:ATPase [Campylobacter jejuni]